MRVSRRVYGAGSIAMLSSGMLAAWACSSDGPSIVYAPGTPPIPTSSGGNGSSSGKTSGSGSSATQGDSGGVDAGVYPFTPGDGGKCGAAVGGFPSVTCDVSDEQAAICMTPGTNAACDFSAKCGDPNTCEPFTKNPSPGDGVDNFRMRLLNVIAPPLLATNTIQNIVITAGVDLPPDAGRCGESSDGTGTFNWLLSVDKANSKVLTGGAPASNDPFDVGYCYVHTTISDASVAPVELSASFEGNTFSTKPIDGVLNVPIFIPASMGGGSVRLPIRGAALNGVDVSNNGQCIGQINSLSVYPKTDGGICTDPTQFGVSSCSRWHPGGVLAGYITLQEADGVVVELLGETLCALITGMPDNETGTRHCTPAGLKAGDYNAPKNGKAGSAAPNGNGDSMWLAAQFAASAVKIYDGGAVPLCSGGSVDGG